MLKKPTIKFKKLHPDAKLPSLGSREAAGIDICTIESVTIPAGKRALLKTGFAMAIPAGTVALIWPRSKLANAYGLDRLAGVIDSDYRGEVMISLVNHGEDEVELRKGDKVAQMIIQQHLSWLPIEVVTDLDETERGAKGINSSDMRLQ